MKRLIIDAQLFQTPAWHRGMGKYSLEFIKSVSQLNQNDPQWSGISIVLSRNGPRDQQMINEVTAVLGVEVHYTDMLLSGAEGATEHNRAVIDSFIQEVRSPGEKIDFIITSLMQKEITPVFPSGTFVNKAVIFYDLIPLTFHRTYLQDASARHDYLGKMPELLRADKYLAISKTVANDLTTYLGVAPHRVATIDGGAIDHDETVAPVAVKKPFILMPTGNDLRKNNRRGIEGFVRFNKKHGNAYTLVVTSFFTDEEIRAFSNITSNVHFTGNISGAKLKYLYQETAAVLFPSEYEGLGLPVLEALKEGTSVACSDISVFREISKDAFALFDPKHVAEIADALEAAVQAQPNAKAVERILDRYNWNTTAILAQKFLQIGHEATMDSTHRIMIAAADPTASSRASKLILQAHGELARTLDVSYYCNEARSDSEQRVDFLPYVSTVSYFGSNRPIHIPDAVLPLYHLENTEESAFIAFTALAKPGILFLHDTTLERVWESLDTGGLISERRLLLERTLNEKYGAGRWLVSLVQRQKAIVVFSQVAKQHVESLLADLGQSVPVYLFKVPVNVLAYDDVLPEKGETVLTLSDILSLDDMTYEEALSKAPGVFIDDVSTNSLVAAGEAAKYGAATFVPPGVRVAEAQEKTYDQALQDIQKKSYNKKSTKVKLYDYEYFTKSITEIVKDIKEKKI
jgi:hypothetical protein